jgi:hypothetical protein
MRVEEAVSDTQRRKFLAGGLRRRRIEPPTQELGAPEAKRDRISSRDPKKSASVAARRSIAASSHTRPVRSDGRLPQQLAAEKAIRDAVDFGSARPMSACTVEPMVTDPAGLPGEPEITVVWIEDTGDAGGLTLDQLIAEIAADEPVILPKPAATYLEEAREADET